MLSKDYILGFVEGEGCFSVAISRNIDRKPRLTSRVNKIANPCLFIIKLTFRVTNCSDNIGVLNEIKETLGFGRIYTQNRNTSYARPAAYFYTTGLKEAQLAREYFKGDNFRTTKGKDFGLWCECIKLFESGKHLGKDGVLAICDLRDQMNDRLAKKKWTKEDILKAYEEKPIHIASHFGAGQLSIAGDKVSERSSVWLEKKQGNFKPQRETKKEPPKAQMIHN